MGCLFGSGRANRGEVTILYTGREGIFHYVDDPNLNIFTLGGAVAWLLLLFFFFLSPVIWLNLCSRFIENLLIAALDQGFSWTSWVSKFSRRRRCNIS